MDNVLVVSHGEMIGAIMAYLEGWDVLNWVHYIRNDKWRLHNCDLVIYSRSRERVPNRYFPFDQRVIAKFSFSEHCYEDRCETPLSEQRFARDAETLAIQAHLLGEARVPFFDPCR
jgi:hypothetical protein